MSISRFKTKKDSSMELARFLAQGGKVNSVAPNVSSKKTKASEKEVDFNALPPELAAKYKKQA